MAARTRYAEAGRPQTGWMGAVWKWGAGSLSACAALVSILSYAHSLDPTARWVGVSPAVDTAFAIGDTIQLAATVTDQRGRMLTTLPIGWSTTDSAVALVDSSGAVIARTTGMATIVAAVGGRVAQARIVV